MQHYTEASRKALAKQVRASGIPDALNVFKTRSLAQLNASAEHIRGFTVASRERVIVNPRYIPKPPAEPMSEETKEFFRRKAEVERSFRPKKPPKPKREDAYKGDEVIGLLVAGNPCRPGTAAHAVFECYRHGMTVAEFAAAAAKACPGKLRPVDYVIYDSRKGRIAVGAAGSKPGPAPKPEPKKKPAPKAPAKPAKSKPKLKRKK